MKGRKEGGTDGRTEGGDGRSGEGGTEAGAAEPCAQGCHGAPGTRGSRRPVVGGSGRPAGGGSRRPPFLCPARRSWARWPCWIGRGAWPGLRNRRLGSRPPRRSRRSRRPSKSRHPLKTRPARGARHFIGPRPPRHGRWLKCREVCHGAPGAAASVRGRGGAGAGAEHAQHAVTEGLHPAPSRTRLLLLRPRLPPQPPRRRQIRPGTPVTEAGQPPRRSRRRGGGPAWTCSPPRWLHRRLVRCTRGIGWACADGALRKCAAFDPDLPRSFVSRGSLPVIGS